jgi:hypothetical protein
MHYTTTKVHNIILGEDSTWNNMKIYDVTNEQLGEIMKIVRPMYEVEMEKERKEHEEYMGGK